MKGMNASLVLNEPDNRKLVDTLKAIFIYTCKRHGVPYSQQNDLVRNGMKQFEITDSERIIPCGEYKTIDEYVIAHRGEKIPDDDSKRVIKNQLYNRLVESAEDENMLEYRKLRKQYLASVQLL